jgi:hypothetical protein
VDWTWKPGEIAVLRHGYLRLGLEAKALTVWCNAHSVLKTHQQIRLKLRELKYFQPVEDEERLRVEQRKALTSERWAKQHKEAMLRAKLELKRQVALAKSEAAIAPLFRPSEKELNAYSKK